MKEEVKIYRCRKCRCEFPESHVTSITEDEKDICPACGKVLDEDGIWDYMTK